MNAGESTREENRIMLLGINIKMGTERRVKEREKEWERETVWADVSG